MSDILWQILLSLLTSTTIVGVAAFLLKRFIDYYLKSQFDSRIEHLRHEQQKELAAFKAYLGENTVARQELFKDTLVIFKEISTAVYLCRNAARDLLQTDDGSQYVIAKEHLTISRQHLASQLADHRLLLGDYFASVHSYKKDIQDYEAYAHLALSEDKQAVLPKMQVKYQSIEKQYFRIVDVLQRHVARPSGTDREQ